MHFWGISDDELRVRTCPEEVSGQRNATRCAENSAVERSGWGQWCADGLGGGSLEAGR